ncbi:hypothetical protein D3C81_302340 [compost metagenome]
MPPVTPPMILVTVSRGLPPLIPPVTPPIILVTVSTGLVEPILPVTVPTASETRLVVVVVSVFVAVDRVSESRPEVDM